MTFIEETTGSNSEDVWRSGKLMVMRKGAQLPDRCIKTNQPANGKRFKATLYWHPPLIYLLLLVNLIVYAIVAIAVGKQVIVYVGITEEVLHKRRQAIVLGWATGIAGLVLFFYSVSLESLSTMVILIFLSITLMLGGLIGGIIKATIVKAERIDDQYIWLRGVNREYLNLLPKWNQQWGSNEWNK